MNTTTNSQNKTVFLIGSKGIPARYGGFETFIEKLTQNQVDTHIQYYVSCLTSDKEQNGLAYDCNHAKCFEIWVPNVGSAKAVIYDWKSINWVIRFIKENDIRNADIYVCTCRIGPIIALKIHEIRKLGARMIINPDGHEWMRAKWNWVIKKYWKFSERLCVKYADVLVCDSCAIEKYIKREYLDYNPNTIYISYGADITKSSLSDSDERITQWFRKWKIEPGKYYANIARFVPENNYETIIREFMSSRTDKSLIITASPQSGGLYKELKELLQFENDKRIKFVGEIYDQELLRKIRENAFGYIHGHSVGGTNPSLLDAIATIGVNLVYDCEFNKEVCQDVALYWNLSNGDLRKKIEEADLLTSESVEKKKTIGRGIIEEKYTWKDICHKYEDLFEVECGELKSVKEKNTNCYSDI